ncbi:hypothetical protein J6590_014817 [Homalodisca vitripennis]|nr:hypothetical protein J6590_014817 [Homalodisca vitripennis]
MDSFCHNPLEYLPPVLLRTDQPQPGATPASFPCPDCGRNYKYKKTLRQHRFYECNKEPRFQCEFCDYRSKLKGNLKIHLQEVSVELIVEKKRTLSCSPDNFLGFEPVDVKPTKRLTELASSIRVLQPRSSKSRASKVWQRPARSFVDCAIKEEPEDDLLETRQSGRRSTVDTSPTKQTEKETPRKAKAQGRKTIRSLSNEELDEEVVNVSSPSKTKPKSITTSRRKGLQGEKDTIHPLNNAIKAEVTDEIPRNVNTKKVRESLTNGSVNSRSSASISGNRKQVVEGMTKIRKRRLIKTSNKTAFKCDQCGKIYKYLRGMRQHKKLECNIPPQFPCPYCPSSFRYRQNIREHVRNFHEQAFPKWYATHYVAPLLMGEGSS